MYCIQPHCMNFPIFWVLLVGCRLTELRAGEKCYLHAARTLFIADFSLPFSRSWFFAPSLSLTFSVLAQLFAEEAKKMFCSLYGTCECL